MFLKSSIRLEGSDHELIQKYRNSQDTVYAGELFQRYSHLVFGLCMKYLKDTEKSKDAVMGIFEKLMSDMKKYTISNFSSWLYSVAKNYCMMEFRKTTPTNSMNENSMSNADKNMENENIQHLNIENDEELHLDLMQEGLIELNKEQKLCIELFYFQQKCYKEIVELTGYNLNAVKSHIQNGKRNLKNFILNKKV